MIFSSCCVFSMYNIVFHVQQFLIIPCQVGNYNSLGIIHIYLIFLTSDPGTLHDFQHHENTCPVQPVTSCYSIIISNVYNCFDCFFISSFHVFCPQKFYHNINTFPCMKKDSFHLFIAAVKMKIDEIQ